MSLELAARQRLCPSKRPPAPTPASTGLCHTVSPRHREMRRMTDVVESYVPLARLSEA